MPVNQQKLNDHRKKTKLDIIQIIPMVQNNARIMLYHLAVCTNFKS